MLRSPWFWFFVLLVIFAPATIIALWDSIVPLITTFFHNLGTIGHSARTGG
jgi:hypothetical protein